MATIPSVQLFRNSIIKTGRQAAIDALEAQKASVADGGLILARYSEDGTENGVKTLLGIVRNGGGTNVQLTVIDVEGAAENVQTAITNAINDLDSSATSENKYFDVTVAQEDGKITSLTVTNKDIASASLLGTKEDASTAETAFGRIAKEAADRKAAIEAMSLSPVGDTGKVITAITQTNGIVSATAATLSADNVAFTSSDTAFTSNNVSAALDTLYTRSGDGSKVVIDSGTTTEGYSKTYTFTQGGIEIGKIDIPKDLVVKSGSVVKGNWNDGVFTENVSGSGTALKLVIANKEETPIYINTLDLVKDHTGGNGIAISDTNEISVKKASDSEPFLTVGADGVKLSGVQAAISAAAASAKTKVEKASDATHITLASSTAADGSVTYTIGQNDIASANALIDETNARQTQDNKIEAAVGLDAEGNHITPTGNYTKGATTVVGEIAALDTKLKEVSDTLGTGVSTAEGKTVTEQLQALSGRTGDASGVTSVEGAKAYAKDLVENLDADVESTTESTLETTTTKAIRIKQTDGKIASITLGAFDCGVY